MSERRAAGLRLILLVLLLLNIALIVYIVVAPDPSSDARSRIDVLQIHPGRIKVLAAANRGPGAAAPGAASVNQTGGAGACLEWGPFEPSDTVRAGGALAELKLVEPATRRPITDTAGPIRYAYVVREPDADTVGRIAELQRQFPGTQIKATSCPG